MGFMAVYTYDTQPLTVWSERARPPYISYTDRIYCYIYIYIWDSFRASIQNSLYIYTYAAFSIME